MPHKRGHHDIGCEQLFCFDLACNFHRMLILQSSSEQGMNEPYKCLRCGQTQCSHTPPDLPDLVDSTPSPPRLYPRLPSAPPAELSDDSSVESVGRITTHYRCRNARVQSQPTHLPRPWQWQELGRKQTLR